MKEYKCIKDFYVEDVNLARKGDIVKLLNDNCTIININNKKKGIFMNGILDNKEYFVEASNNDDKVNHPSHYTWLKDKCGIEVIDITRHLDFCTGNAIKYLLRAGHKTEESYSDKQKEIEDLKKAIWYINDKINHLK